MKKSNGKNNLTFLLAILLLVSLGVVGYGNYLLITKANEVVRLKESNASESTKIVSISSLRKRTEELGQISDKFDHLYIERNNLLSFIELVERIGNTNGVNITFDKVDLNEDNINHDRAPYGILQMTISVSGSWQGVTSFLLDIESMPYLVDIRNVRLSSSPSDGSWTLNMAFEVITN